MSTERNKWIDVIAKMLKLTQEGKLAWKAEQPPAQLGGRSDRRVELVFTSIYKEKRLRLYQYAFQSEEVDVSPYDGSISRTMQWRTKPILEIVDRSGAALWKFPNVSALNDLLYSVQYQVAGAKELLDDFMKE